MIAWAFDVMKKKNLIIIISVLVLSVAVIGFASLPDGVEFRDLYKLPEAELKLIGYGIKKIVTVKVVAAAFYLPEGVPPEKILTDVPKRIEVVYLLNIPKSELDRAAVRGIRRNVSKEEFARLEPKIEELNRYWPSVRRYDRIAVTYFPNRGMVINVNGQDTGVVEGEDLAKALFSVWVGENPADKAIKAKLLGQLKEEM
jgi:hypothetical protein